MLQLFHLKNLTFTILFVETRAIAYACKIIIFSLLVLLLLYISCKKFFIEEFFTENYVKKIYNVINHKIFQRKYIAHQFPQINHYLSLLDIDIVLRSHSHKQYLFKGNLNLLANKSTPNIAKFHIEQNLTASCLRCWSTGFTKREIPMQQDTITEMYAKKCTDSQVYNDCTYRQNSISDIISDEVRLSIYFLVLWS